MNVPSVLIWGPLATAVMTTVEMGAQGLGLTRMSMPFLLGTMVTPNRDRAGLLGLVMHLLNGIIFAFIYAGIFDQLRTSWWLGVVIGLVHALFILAVIMPLMPTIHPRMASETAGPTQVKQLQPAGFFAIHYGRQTMLVVFLSHALYGLILGSFYDPPHRSHASPAQTAPTSPTPAHFWPEANTQRPTATRSPHDPP